MTVLSMTEVSKACGILFGPQVEVSLDFLKYLQPSGLKSAYRKKALETHPDRARIIGEDETKMTELFRETTFAYNKLISVIKSNRTIFLRNRVGLRKKREESSEREHQQTGFSGFSDRFYTGDIPSRNLLIGQFLYYSGIISWKTLINAMVWQRRQRPVIGQIALEWRKLSEHEIQRILVGRNFGERFGECAARTGYLTRFEVMTLLGSQRRLQSPFGEYFVRRGILRDRDMENMVARQLVHNRRISYRRR